MTISRRERMDTPLTIGLDFGTDSVRAVLARVDNGDIMATHVHAYPRWSRGDYCDAAAAQYRQHPLDYLEGTEAVVRRVIDGVNPSRVVGIGIDTTGSTPCAVNRTGTPLALTPGYEHDPDAMFILWKDHTALAEAERINDYARSWGGTDFTTYEGGIYSSEWFWSKILHVLRTSQRVREAAFSFVEHCDWMCAELAGVNDPLTMKRSRCAAGHKALWHESWGGLPPEAFLSGVDPLLSALRERLYSETHTAERSTGKLCATWAKKLGLSTDVMIAGGMIDCHSGAVGAGIKPNELVKVFGTSTCDILVSKAVPGCVRGICGQVNGSVVPGLIGLEAGQAAFGDVYAWYKRFMSYEGPTSLTRLENEAAALPLNPQGLLALDWFTGRRSPDANPYLSGALLGLNLGTTPALVYRALVEATCCGARAIIERFISEGIAVDAVLAIGGISRKSPFVMQMCADLFNMPIRVAASDQVCALGGAMFAAVAAGIYTTTEDAMAHMNPGFDVVYSPVPAHVKAYELLYRRYQRYARILEDATMAER